MTLREKLIAKALLVSDEEGVETALNWLLDNYNPYYREDMERMERKLAVRDRLLFYKQTED